MAIPVLTLIILHVVVVAVTIAAPNVAFPFNSQVPPVARVGHKYEFTFSPTTFVPNDRSFQYMLTDAPTWLHLDSPSRTFTGTPGIADVGSPKFTIIASDGSGKTSMQATLVVVSHVAPQLGASISSSLEKAGKMCGPSSVTFPPRSSFEFDFPVDTFKVNGKGISYYSTLSDHTPLPGWLNFDPKSLHYQGFTPPLSASPQRFEVLLIASDVPGFASAWLSFSIVVSDHQFHFQDAERDINLGPGASINVKEMRSQLFLDGKPISDADLTSSASDAPSWLSFEPHALSLIGTPPSGTSTQDVHIAAHDRFGDAANTTLHLRIFSGLFSKEFGSISASTGKGLVYTFDKSIFAQPDLRVTIDLGAATNYLHFDSNTLTLQGTIPDDLPAQDIQCNIIVSSRDGSQKDTQAFVIAIKQSTPTSTISTRSSHSSAATGGVFAAAGPPDRASSRRRTGLIIGVVLAILVILLLVGSIFWWRSPRRGGGSGLQRSHSAFKKKISAPLIPRVIDGDEYAWCTDIREHEHEDLEKGSEEYDRTPDDPPQIILNLSPKKGARRSTQLGFTTASSVKPGHGSLAGTSHNPRMSVASSTIEDNDAIILDNINRTSWGYMGTSSQKQAHDSMRLANQMARASRQMDNSSPTPYRRPSRHMPYRMSPAYGVRNSNIRTPSGGLPVNPRLTGLGHGRSPPGPNRNSMLGIFQMQQQQPYRTPSLSSQYSGRPGSALSSHPPQRQLSQLGCQRRNARDSQLLDPRRASIQRPVPRRAQRSPFFSGGHSSRGSSRSGNRSTVLGLSTIHGSPDIGIDSPAAESSDALAMEPSASVGAKDDAGREISPLRRNPTQTSSKTTKTWQTSTTAQSSDASGEQSRTQSTAPREVPPLPPRNPAHTSTPNALLTSMTPNGVGGHKRWSSQHIRARLSKPFSTNTAILPNGHAVADVRLSGISSPLAPPRPPRHSSMRDSTLFASADEADIAEDSSADDADDDRIASSIYSQLSLAVASPTHRPPTRGKGKESSKTKTKVPTGGVRLPPFSSDNDGSPGDSIMARPHPRVPFRRRDRDKSHSALMYTTSGALRTPLRNMRGGENGRSGSGIGLGGSGVDLGGKGVNVGKERKGLAARLRSSRGRRPVSVEGFGGSGVGVGVHGSLRGDVRDGSGVAFL
ncbi:hypothetical protein EJ08DRAFT_214031 [Tothia fuscella]|uniref:Dystroglycan-type cadherin-like domain-containing protein n=1 Tax=Tothia fuscella TaxID=1048955 RepID=A0A9P4NR82_9PEZI|nr:hypothetical protein EJ08DRAFT_214031 [Tothia fuscella]